jgi:hypothetical protein
LAREEHGEQRKAPAGDVGWGLVVMHPLSAASALSQIHYGNSVLRCEEKIDILIIFVECCGSATRKLIDA